MQQGATYLPGFYIFRGERLRDDYIKECKTWTYMVMQNKAQMATFLFKEFQSFFKNLVSSGILQFYIDLSHALQPLDVSCFKPFKIAFRKKRDSVMVKTNNCELNKCTLARQVDKALKQTLINKNIINYDNVVDEDQWGEDGVTTQLLSIATLEKMLE